MIGVLRTRSYADESEHSFSASIVMTVLRAGFQPLLSPTVQLEGFSQPLEDSLSTLCWQPSAKIRTFPEGFQRPPDVAHNTCSEVVFELLCCRFCISRRFFLSSFLGQVGLKHRFHGRLLAPLTNSNGQPQPLHILPVGLTVPFCGSGKEVWQAFLK